jgi:hypothetical protein
MTKVLADVVNCGDYGSARKETGGWPVGRLLDDHHEDHHARDMITKRVKMMWALMSIYGEGEGQQ